MNDQSQADAHQLLDVAKRVWVWMEEVMRNTSYCEAEDFELFAELKAAIAKEAHNIAEIANELDDPTLTNSHQVATSIRKFRRHLEDCINEELEWRATQP